LATTHDAIGNLPDCHSEKFALFFASNLSIAPMIWLEGTPRKRGVWMCLRHHDMRRAATKPRRNLYSILTNGEAISCV
jgi:hypothetical protein